MVPRSNHDITLDDVPDCVPDSVLSPLSLSSNLSPPLSRAGLTPRSILHLTIWDTPHPQALDEHAHDTLEDDEQGHGGLAHVWAERFLVDLSVITGALPNSGGSGGGGAHDDPDSFVRLVITAYDPRRRTRLATHKQVLLATPPGADDVHAYGGDDGDRTLRVVCDLASAVNFDRLRDDHSEFYWEELVKLFEAHNPANLRYVGELLEEYHGREEALLQKFEEQYVLRWEGGKRKRFDNCGLYSAVCVMWLSRRW